MRVTECWRAPLLDSVLCKDKDELKMLLHQGPGIRRNSPGSRPLFLAALSLPPSPPIEGFRDTRLAIYINRFRYLARPAAKQNNGRGSVATVWFRLTSHVVLDDVIGQRVEALFSAVVGIDYGRLAVCGGARRRLRGLPCSQSKRESSGFAYERKSG